MHLILATLLILAATPAMADWTEVSKIDAVTTYIDTPSIQKRGDTVTARVLRDLPSPFRNTLIMSFLEDVEYDCPAHRVKPIETTGFSGQMATGSVLFTATSPFRWSKNIIQKTPSGTLLNYVCSHAGTPIVISAPANTVTDELFIGKFASETRENFGADQFGRFVIEVTKKGDGYTLSYTRDGEPLFALDVNKCSEEALEGRYYHDYALPGEVQVLCGNRTQGVQFFYTQNGIKISEQDLSVKAVYKAQFYANVQWHVYAFKKIK